MVKLKKLKRSKLSSYDSRLGWRGGLQAKHVRKKTRAVHSQTSGGAQECRPVYTLNGFR